MDEISSELNKIKDVSELNNFIAGLKAAPISNWGGRRFIKIDSKDTSSDWGCSIKDIIQKAQELKNTRNQIISQDTVTLIRELDVEGNIEYDKHDRDDWNLSSNWKLFATWWRQKLGNIGFDKKEALVNLASVSERDREQDDAEVQKFSQNEVNIAIKMGLALRAGLIKDNSAEAVNQRLLAMHNFLLTEAIQNGDVRNANLIRVRNALLDMDPRGKLQNTLRIMVQANSHLEGLIKNESRENLISIDVLKMYFPPEFIDLEKARMGYKFFGDVTDLATAFTKFKNSEDSDNKMLVLEAQRRLLEIEFYPAALTDADKTAFLSKLKDNEQKQKNFVTFCNNLYLFYESQGKAGKAEKEKMLKEVEELFITEKEENFRKTKQFRSIEATEAYRSVSHLIRPEIRKHIELALIQA